MRFFLRPVRAIAIIAVLIWLTLASAQETRPSGSTLKEKHSMARRLEVADLNNLAEVTPNLYRGAQPSSKGLKKLTKMGIDIVVDLRGNRAGERAQVEKLGMTYVAIPWHCPFPKDEAFAKFIALTRANPSKKIFVHCRLGDDRAGMTIASYRMAEQGWSAEEAMNEMQSFGFTRSHHLICPGLAGYEKDFPRRFKDDPAFKGLR
jgi:protein tyrosine/serine phosphatase